MALRNVCFRYNGGEGHSLRNGHGGKKQSKMELRKRIAGNGIKKSQQVNVSAPKESKVSQSQCRSKDFKGCMIQSGHRFGQCFCTQRIKSSLSDVARRATLSYSSA